MFVHRLCLELHMTKRDLGERMTVSEMIDWIEYFDNADKDQPAQMSAEQIAAAFGAEVQRG